MAIIAEKNGLVLFFTLGVTLENWQKAGYLQREADYYRLLGESVGPIAWVTYGGAADAELGTTLDGIRVLTNRDGLSNEQFASQLPMLFPDVFRTTAIFKSNQIKGAQAAISAAKQYHGKAIVRCGYLLSRFRANRKLSLRMRVGLWRKERRLFQHADHVFLPTVADMAYAERWYGLKNGSVLPNFVDVDLFKPDSTVQKTSGLVGFVGRLAPQKNLSALIEAASQVEGVKLRFIGEGEQAQTLQMLADELGVSLELIGNVPQEEIPRLLANCEVFALPSLYEGMPKALVEAMAMELAVVATKVEGSETLLQHKRTGWLCPSPSADDLSEGLRQVFADMEPRRIMGQAARARVVEQFSRQAVLNAELAIYRNWLNV